MPLQDIFWATLMFAGFALSIWLLFVVLRDLFDRPDLSAGAKVGWTLLACLLPIVGSLIYLVTPGPGRGGAADRALRQRAHGRPASTGERAPSASGSVHQRLQQDQPGPDQRHQSALEQGPVRWSSPAKRAAQYP